jgi:hypothetical protein
MNEDALDKLDNFEKLNHTFQNSLIIENDKFTSYIADQMEAHQKNVKKLVDFTNEDLDLIKNKVRMGVFYSNFNFIFSRAVLKK